MATPSGRRPEEQALTSLGVVWNQMMAEYPWLLWAHRVNLRNIAVEDRYHIQVGYGPVALKAWKGALRELELDADACRDLLLLAATSNAGRAEANNILWTLLVEYGPRADHRDLSPLASSMVRAARIVVDRPPRAHPEAWVWTWRRALDPRREVEDYGPLAPPPGADLVKRLSPGGGPLPPPYCYVAPPGPPKGPPPQEPRAAQEPAPRGPWATSHTTPGGRQSRVPWKPGSL